MRLWIGLGAAVLALTLVAPGASAHAGAVEVSTDDGSPPARETTFQEEACIPTCEVLMTPYENAPPATIVESGATVTWRAQIAQTHSATSDYPTEDKDRLIVDNAPTYRRDICLDVGISSEAPGRAQLAIVEGQLAVSYPNSADWIPCEEAIGLEDGAWALSYHCNAHPRLQHSVLVVTPSP